jgi:hypothetical protein
MDMLSIENTTVGVGSRVGIRAGFGIGNSRIRITKVTAFNKRTITTEDGKFSATTLKKWGNGDSFYAETLTTYERALDVNAQRDVEDEKNIAKGNVREKIGKLTEKLGYNHFNLQELESLHEFLDDLLEA